MAFTQELLDLLSGWKYPQRGVISFPYATYSIHPDFSRIIWIHLDRTKGDAYPVFVTVTITGEARVLKALDIQETSAEVMFDSNQKTKNFPIRILDEDRIKSGDSVVLTLSNPKNGVVFGECQKTTVTFIRHEECITPESITEAPDCYGVIEFDFPTYSAISNLSSNNYVTLARNNGSDCQVGVTLNFSDESVVYFSSFGRKSIDVIFNQGETSKTVKIPIVEGKDESIELTLSNPTNGAVIGQQNTASLIILPENKSFGKVAFQSHFYHSYCKNGKLENIITLVRNEGSFGQQVVTLILSDGSVSPQEVGIGNNSIEVIFNHGETLKEVNIPVSDYKSHELLSENKDDKEDKIIVLSLFSKLPNAIGQQNKSVLILKNSYYVQQRFS